MSERESHADARRLARRERYQPGGDLPEIIGWEVRDAGSGRRLGDVRAVLVDEPASRVRYLDVCLDPDVAGGDQGEHVLVPIGRAEVDPAVDAVNVSGVSLERLGEIPRYDRSDVPHENEILVLQAYDEGMQDLTGKDLYENNPLFDDVKFWSPRGEMTLEPGHEVTIERRSARDDRAQG